MTEYQISQIREFRMRGAGYKAIASITGLSRDLVRNYCKAHDLDGLAVEVTANLKEKIKQGKVCQRCSEKLIQPATGRRKKFCSDKCRREYWVQHDKSINRKETAFYQKTCEYCKEEFRMYGNKSRKYCSHNCYIRDRFWREEEGRIPYAELSEEAMNE